MEFERKFRQVNCKEDFWDIYRFLLVKKKTAVWSATSIAQGQKWLLWVFVTEEFTLITPSSFVWIMTFSEC